MTRDEAKAAVAALTDKQRDVLLYWASGYTKDETAVALGWKSRAVEFQRLAITARWEITAYEACAIAGKADLV